MWICMDHVSSVSYQFFSLRACFLSCFQLLCWFLDLDNASMAHSITLSWFKSHWYFWSCVRKKKSISIDTVNLHSPKGLKTNKMWSAWHRWVMQASGILRCTLTLMTLSLIFQAGRDKLYLIKRIKQGMSMPVDANLQWFPSALNESCHPSLIYCNIFIWMLRLS